jgi:hypothetical protein
MDRSTRTSVFGLTVVILVSGQPGPAANQRAVAQVREKPVQEEVVDVSYRRPPETAREMVSRAAAVVVAEWGGQSRLVESGVSGAGIPLPKMTAYTFRILEIVKLDPLLPSVGDSIDFTVIGGEKELPTRVERTKNRDALDFVPHHRYVIFIGRDSNTSELYLMWGLLGVYDITSRTVTSLSPAWRRHDGTDATSFVSEVKAAVKR